MQIKEEKISYKLLIFWKFYFCIRSRKFYITYDCLELQTSLYYKQFELSLSPFNPHVFSSFPISSVLPTLQLSSSFSLPRPRSYHSDTTQKYSGSPLLVLIQGLHGRFNLHRVPLLFRTSVELLFPTMISISDTPNIGYIKNRQFTRNQMNLITYKISIKYQLSFFSFSYYFITKRRTASKEDLKVFPFEIP